jgi:predicted unusual protein kinase regulating ubiquinone biosynthesis (AarF/ABC1/UbiB family)
VETVLRQDFGTRADALLEGLERMPVSTASIGQVHRARLPDGTRAAVKVRHEGIDDAIRADFRSAAIGKVLAKVLAPGAEIGEALSEAEARFLEECDYKLERRNQQRLAEIYATDPDLTVPAVRPEWCSQRILTTAWHEGQSVEAFAASAGQGARGRRAGLGQARG